jgi:hypothetical protein
LPASPEVDVPSVVEGNLLTENTALRGRLQRLSPVLPAMAADLAATRREANRLRRENARLLALVGSSAGELTPPLGPMRCDRCGSALLADAPVGAR